MTKDPESFTGAWLAVGRELALFSWEVGAELGDYAKEVGQRAVSGAIELAKTGVHDTVKAAGELLDTDPADVAAARQDELPFADEAAIDALAGPTEQ